MNRTDWNVVRAWWHRYVLGHAQDIVPNDGDGPPRVDCWCNGWPGKPSTWEV